MRRRRSEIRQALGAPKRIRIMRMASLGTFENNARKSAHSASKKLEQCCSSRSWVLSGLLNDVKTALGPCAPIVFVRDWLIRKGNN